jgi:hypothetical protein
MNIFVGDAYFYFRIFPFGIRNRLQTNETERYETEILPSPILKNNSSRFTSAIFSGFKQALFSSLII